MPQLNEALSAQICAQLTPEERNNSIAYVLLTPLPAGTSLKFFPGAMDALPWDAYIAFIDREPMANWGHACRCIFIHPDTHETFSIEARFPPFHLGNRDQWHIIYRASGVPATV